MYLAAQRVEDKRKRRGLNAFAHRHDQRGWPDDAASLPETDPGRLVPWASIVRVPPGGNRVVSYLDVLAPEDAGSREIKQVLDVLDRDLGERKNPTTFRLGRITVRFGADPQLTADREVEYGSLHGAVVLLLRRLGI